MKKKIVLIGGAILVICVIVLAVLLTGQSRMSDAERFHASYPLTDENNVFVYISVREAADILERGTGILYLGFPDCPWCQTYVPILNMVALEMGLEQIYYANIDDARARNTADYRRIVQVLEDRLDLDDDGNPRVFVPFIAAARDGVVVGHDSESSMNFRDPSITSPVEYWTNWRVDELMGRLRVMIEAVM